MSFSGQVVTSRTNPRLKQLRAAFQGQARLSSGLIAVEGEHMVEEALKSGQALKTVFLSERMELPAYVPASVEVVSVASDVFASIAETRTPQGIAALLVPPAHSVEKMLEGPGEALILIAVGLQDPGNLGTLIRSAEAFGATGVLTTPGTVSPWNQKAMRASAGSVFRLPVAVATPDAMETLEQQGIKLLAAMKDDAVAIGEADLTVGSAILIGNEGAGLNEDWLRLADQRVTIPCPGWVESLNAAVAGSILLYEASRQRGART
ncbi:TrmH family RNA methyltransferase [Granulicella tundricola]|uniref:tRNA/rRNA methyltransferase (SpoU) n=1 Tax=Granulicella tundricola (strain ATCC BAA-1859 / DSM 23138 / MP5ACTX9) TaxID=1198114 RepID=E8X4K0_GRATM|nr:RNA methyltransferase [Granulicella tundricola]ADW69410.1 tRNA/rRNA methyltransferase (SpoU) [Granulicella tundricola MP5ACTX9]